MLMTGMHYGLAVFLAIFIFSNAQADYKQLLTNGTSIDEVRELYEVYASSAFEESGEVTSLLDELAGDPKFKDSFMLACLSNGWIVRAQDVTQRYLPPAGVWAFSEPHFQGRMVQLPSNCQDSQCMDVSSLGDFEIQSMRIGSAVQACLYSETNFGGKLLLKRDDLETLAWQPKSMKLRTPPRIDYVSLSGFSSSGRLASFKVHISGANLDREAELLIDDIAVPTQHEARLLNATWIGLGKDVAQAGYNLDPTFFQFPILHYDSVVTSLVNSPVQGKLRVQVRNADGQISNTLTYVVPTDETLDSDGDGLLDSWETKGIEGLNLASLGADPLKKDIYVEVDQMVVQGRVWSDFQQDYPRADIFSEIERMFSQAPIFNPDLSTGINLHIDYGQSDFEGTDQAEGGTEVPWKRFIGFEDVADTNLSEQPENYCNATQLRMDPKFFAVNRRKVFRYCIFSDQQWNSRSTGRANKSSVMCLTLGVCRLKAIDRNYQIGVFTHELGHLLSLTHTGNNGNGPYNNKPNFNSLMNYLYTFPGHDIDGRLGAYDGKITGDQVYAYSEGMRAPLNESELSEVLGAANHYPHDWNGDGEIQTEPVKVFLRDPTYTIPRTLTDCADWAMLKFPIVD